MHRARSLAFLVLANLFWAGNFVFGAVAVEQVDPISLTWMRWLGAAPILIVLALAIERPAWRTVFADWPRQILLALLGMIGFCVLTYEAFRHTSPMDASLINAINPALIAIAAAGFARTRVGGRAIAGLLISLAGVLLVLTKGDLAALAGFRLNLGEGIMIVAVVVWSAYTLLGRTSPTPPITGSALQGSIALVLLSPVVAVTGLTVPAAPEVWANVAYIAVFPSVLSFMLWNLAVRDLGAGPAGITLNLMPVFVALIGLTVGLPITLDQLAGGALVIAGVLLTNLPVRTGMSRVDAGARPGRSGGG
ncbi:DMT family transporter [Agromyces archimandritae]|uniref:DMT family transporter n=1 Tax=Agromyces archimandritae TaxID=2781962 RepID=A0A975IN35_9MICO|nr:DMT family transporter [Agromyces archimandritae]QTX04192.1 DMT family transporter [Agromyces archimandritae]